MQQHQAIPGRERVGLPPAGAAQQQIPGLATTPFGQAGKCQQRYPALTRDARCDVCIVGGGLSGLLTAYRLAQAGKHVVVVEAFAVGAGSSGKSLGMLSGWNSCTLGAIEATAGNARARQAAQAHSAAAGWVEGVVKAEGLQCGFQRVPGHAMDRAAQERGRGSSRAYAEFCACGRVGLMSAKMEHIGVGTGVTTGGLTQALSLPECANIDPMAFIQGMAEAAVRAGVRIFEGTRAKGGIITGPHQGLVQTLGGLSIQAKDAVVLATHSPINRDQLWVHDRQLPMRSYAVGLEVPLGSIQDAQLWDLSGSGHALRLAPMPGRSESNVLLVQGERHLQGQSPKSKDPYAALEAYVRCLFPQCVDVVYRWSTTDYYPADLLGLYGKDPLTSLVFDDPSNYILTGHGGHDMTGAVIGSEVVANSILGPPNPWAQAFSPSRVLPGAVLRYALELTTYFTNIALYLAKHVVPRSLADIQGLLQPGSVGSGLAPGDGMVVQRGWRKAAVSRDDVGELHVRSAVCTHLGCCVSYNAIEKHFDCACHGSMFDKAGRCMHGPAVADLEDIGSPGKAAKKAA